MKIGIKFFSLLLLILLSVVLSKRARFRSKARDPKIPIEDTLHEGEYLMSKNDKYKLIMQKDGNLVLYSLTPNNKKDHDNPVWQTHTKGEGKGPYKAVMEAEGALTVVDGTGKKTWESEGMKPGVGPYTIQIQRDGNLVAYDKTGFPTWASQTWKKTMKKK